MSKQRDTLATHEARSRFAAVVEDVAFRGKRIVLTSYGRDRCALVSMDDLAKLEAMETAKRSSAKRRSGGRPR